MTEASARAARYISLALDALADELAADEATIIAGMTIALANRLAEQAITLGSARADLDLITMHLEATVEIYFAQKLGR
jgi:hypothetical protein